MKVGDLVFCPFEGGSPHGELGPDPGLMEWARPEENILTIPGIIVNERSKFVGKRRLKNLKTISDRLNLDVKENKMCDVFIGGKTYAFFKNQLEVISESR